MARDGAGAMSVPYPDFQSGTTISSTEMDANNADIVAELTNSLPRDGQAAPTANIPMGANKFTGLGAGSVATDSANLGQVQAQAYIWCGTAGGTKNARTLTPSPAITAYAAGQVFRFKNGSTQSDDNVTLEVSGLTAKTVQSNGSALSATVYLEASKWYEVLYDGAAFQVVKKQLYDGTFQPLDATLTGIAALTGLTDNRLIRTDGTVGLYQQSGITVDDSDNVSGITSIAGTTTNDNAAAGKIGEIIESTVLVGDAVSLTSTNNKDITSISLTAGDWDVWGNVVLVPAGTPTFFATWIHTVSATLPTVPNGGAYHQLQGTFTAAGTAAFQTGTRRLSLSGTTTVYLEALATFSSTATAYGYIGARRVR